MLINGDFKLKILRAQATVAIDRVTEVKRVVQTQAQANLEPATVVGEHTAEELGALGFRAAAAELKRLDAYERKATSRLRKARVAYAEELTAVETLAAEPQFGETKPMADLAKQTQSPIVKPTAKRLPNAPA